MNFSRDQVLELIERVQNGEQELSKEELTTLLKNQHSLTYFKYNVDEYCKLHSLVIANLCNSAEYLAFLKDDYTFQKVMRDRDQFNISFLQIVVPTLIDVCLRFKENEVFEETSKLLQKCFFSTSVKQFDSYLTQLFAKIKTQEKHSLCKTVLKFLTNLYNKNAICPTGFKLLFNSLVYSHKNFNTVFKMLLLLIEIIGFDTSTEFNFNKIKYHLENPSLNDSLNILRELLDVVSKTKFNLECNIGDVTFNDFIKNLLKSIMALTKVPNTYCYQIFTIVIEINPLIIESLINEILIYTMLSDNSQCRKEYEELMIKIFEVFSKLHRIQNLISKMIPTLKSGLENRKLDEAIYTFRGELNLKSDENILYNIDCILPKSVLNYFTNCIINLASWQVINLFKTLLFHFNKTVEELPEKTEETIYTEILSCFICWVLMSVRMAEHTVASTTVVKFVGGLEELRNVLGKLGRTLLQRPHNQILMRAFLNISYYWAEIYMSLEYYSVKHDFNLIKVINSNFSACNLTYLHSYLTDKEWCLISERINNFGEKPCKQIMQRLMIQKLRAMLMSHDSNSEITTAIIRTLSSEFDDSSVEIFTDRFVINHLLDKMPSTIIVNLSEIILQDLLEGTGEIFKQPHIYDSRLITEGILCVIFTKINKLLKQKRKHDDATLRKAHYSKILSLLPTDMFLAPNIGEFLVKASEVVSEGDEQIIDLKLHSDKIQAYLDAFRRLPVLFASEDTQKFIILLLFSLLKDINHSNCEEEIKNGCESLIISIIQHNKFTLLDIFEANILVKLLIENVVKSEDLFTHIVQSAFKCDSAIAKFESGIAFIKGNLKSKQCLRFAVNVLLVLHKMKKIKVSPESKELCLKYKTDICHKIAKLVLKKSPEDGLIEPFAIVLKSFLAKDEDDNLSKLKISLSDYVEYCLENLSDENIKGSLLLFSTILFNKSLLNNLDDAFILRIYNSLKRVTVKTEMLEEYSQLMILITSLIPNEQFSKIFDDLLKVTTKSIDLRENKEFCKHLKTWSCILSTNFNPVKTNILREQLEFLLEKLILMLKSVDYSEELFEEVIQFELSIVQANHVPLSAAIIDFSLLTVSILMMKKDHDFIHCFNCGITLLENLLKSRNPLIMDRLPPYLLQYRVLLKGLCLKSSSKAIAESSDGQKIADCAHKLEKLTKSLADCTKDMARIAMYLIADILAQYEMDTLYPNVKKHLDNCIYSLIALCDHHAVQYLMRVLSNASTEIFKIMYENYKTYYRFTGKV
ncbi:uncharacterized protein LOC123014085 isoform X2 [Tribolium madens]|uniref:uncharacterized protein LOC123014085 isoform X2 n=1 Tax=Tribolium madens TaxID=41895 RepID=UPI001CF7363F|nr:uncharacterized protein LOC123014085 isoform X2 [Tribolium madens]